MITRIDYQSRNAKRSAICFLDDTLPHTPWTVLLAGDIRVGEADHEVGTLKAAQQIARAWVDRGRKP